MLTVTAPASGVVATADPQNLVNRDVTDGEVLLTIVNPKQLVARLYIPSSEMQWVRTGDAVSLQTSSQFREIRGRLGVMEYYQMRNLQSDTQMRTAIAGVGGNNDRSDRPNS